MPLDPKTADLMLTDFGAWENTLDDNQRQQLETTFKYEPDRGAAQKRFASVAFVAANTGQDVEDVSRRFEDYYMHAYARDEKGLGIVGGVKDTNEFHGLLIKRANDNIIKAEKVNQARLTGRESGLSGASMPSEWARFEKAYPKATEEEKLAFADTLFQASVKALPYRKLIKEASSKLSKEMESNIPSTGTFQEVASQLLSVPENDRPMVISMIGANGGATAQERSAYLSKLAGAMGRMTETVAASSLNMASDAVLYGLLSPLEGQEQDTVMPTANDDEFRILTQQIRQMADAEIAPIKGDGWWSQTGIDVARMTPQIAVTLANPAIGMAANTAYFRDTVAAQAKSEDPSLSYKQAAAIGDVSAPFNAAIETVTALIPFGKIKMPFLQKWLSTATTTISGTARKFVVRGALGVASEVGEEMAQAVIPLWTQDALAALNKDRSEVDWQRRMPNFSQIAQQTWGPALVFGIVGGGVVSIKDIKNGRALASDVDMMVATGINPETAVKIKAASDAEDYNAADSLFRAEFVSETKASKPDIEAATERLKARFKAQENVEALTETTSPEYTASVTRTPSGWQVTTGDGTIIPVESAEAARRIFVNLRQVGSQQEADALVNVIDGYYAAGKRVDTVLTGEDVKASETVGVVATRRDAGGAVISQRQFGPQALETVRAEAEVAGIKSDTRKVFAHINGSNEAFPMRVADGAKGVTRILNLYRSQEESQPQVITFLHENIESSWRLGMANGTFSEQETRTAFNALLPAFEGIQTTDALELQFIDNVRTLANGGGNDTMMRETVSEMVVRDVLGRDRDGRATGMKPGSISRAIEASVMGANTQEQVSALKSILAAIKAFTAYLKAVFSTVDAISTARDEGKLGEDWIGFVDKVLGIDEVKRDEGLAMNEAQAILEDSNMPFSISPASTVIVNGDFFKNPNSFYRVIQGDEALSDVIQSGEVRTNAATKIKEGMTLAEKMAARPTAFPSFSKGSASMSYAAENANHSIIVSNDESMNPSTSGRHSAGRTYFPTVNGIHQKSLSNNFQVYKHIGSGEYALVYKKNETSQLFSISVPTSDIDTIPEDLARAEADMKAGGKDWAAKVDLSQPVGVYRGEDGRLKLFDGHHRWLAARERGEPLQVRESVFGRAVPIGEAPVVADMPDGAQLVGPATFSITAYHGTPHKVDKFTTAKIGTGEGAQAYGWGLYFAESRDVGEQYQRELSDSDILLDGKKIIATSAELHIAVTALYGKSKDSAISFLESVRARSPGEAIDKALELVKFDRLKIVSLGNLYTVELLPDEADFLDWDKPLSEQSEKVKAALSHIMAFAPAPNGATPDGQVINLYFGGGRAAAEKLASLGIPGIKYLDGNSRDGGSGTSNYVIFDESLVKILEENGRKVEGQSFSISPITPAQDAEYLAAVEAGDMAKAQRLVDEAAKKARLKKVWRKGSVTKKGEGGFHFGTKEQADSIEDERQKSNTYFIKVSNPVRLIDYSDWSDSGLETQGYDLDENAPIVYLNRHEGLGDEGAVDLDGNPLLPQDQDSLSDEEFLDANPSAQDSFIIRSSSQIKSADPVTRDESGAVIPLSQRFNDATPDIRFSISPIRNLNELSDQVERQFAENPVGALEVKSKVIRQFAKLADKWSQERWTPQGNKIRPISDKRTAKSLDKEQAMRQARALDEILANQGFTSADAMKSKDAKDYEAWQRFQESKYLLLSGGMTDEEAQKLAGASASTWRKNFVNAIREATKKAKAEAQAWRDEADAMQKEDWSPKESLVRDLITLEAIVAMFPQEIRGKIGGFVTLARKASESARLKVLQKQLERGQVLLEKHLKEQYNVSLLKMLDKAAPVGKPGEVKKSKFIVTVQDELDAISEIVGMDSDDVTESITTNEAAIISAQTPEAADVALTRLNLLELFGGILDLKRTSSQEMEVAHEYLAKLMKQGREARKMIDEARSAKVKEMVATAKADAFKGQTGPETTQAARAKAAKGSGKAMLKKFFNELSGFDAVLRDAFGPQSETARSFSERFTLNSNDFEDVQNERRTRFRDFARELYQTKLGAKINQKLIKLERIENNSSVTYLKYRKVKTHKFTESDAAKIVADPKAFGFTDKDAAAISEEIQAIQDSGGRRKVFTYDQIINDGDRVEIPLSQMDAVYISMALRQPGILEQQERHGYDQQTVDELDKYLTDEAKAWRRWMQMEYDAEYQQANEVYMRMFNARMPMIMFYAPLLKNHQGQQAILDPLNTGISSNSANPGSIKTRKGRTSSLRIESALTVFWAHFNQMEYWIANAEYLRDVQAVLLNPEVRESVVASHGEDGMATISAWIQLQMSRGVGKAALVSAGNKIFRNVKTGLTMKALALSYTTALKTLPSVFYSLGEIHMSKWPSALTSGMKHWGRLWKTNIIQRRLDIGGMPELRDLGSSAMPMSWMNQLIKYGSAPAMYADGVFTTFSAAMAYGVNYDEAIRQGASEDLAHKHAEERTALIVSRTAQPENWTQKSLLENDVGAFGSMFTLFMSDPRQKMALTGAALNQFRKGNVTSEEAARKFLAYWVIPGIMFQLANAIGRSLFKGDDDEWEVVDFATAALVGQLQGLVLLGSGVESIFSAAIAAAAERITGEEVKRKPFWNSSKNPLDQAAQDLIKSAENLNNTDKDVFEKTWEVIKSVGMLTTWLNPAGAVPATVERVIKDTTNLFYGAENK